MNATKLVWDFQLRERVAKAVALLDSTQPGEVLAAAGALQRVLRGSGADLHTLCDFIRGAQVIARDRNDGPSDFDRLTCRIYAGMLREIQERAWALKAGEPETVRLLAAKLANPDFRWNGGLTQAELQGLYDLHAETLRRVRR